MCAMYSQCIHVLVLYVPAIRNVFSCSSSLCVFAPCFQFSALSTYACFFSITDVWAFFWDYVNQTLIVIQTACKLYVIINFASLIFFN